MESVEFIYSCADCGFQTIDEFLLDDHLESYHSNRMPNGPNIIHEIFPNAREQFSFISVTFWSKGLTFVGHRGLKTRYMFILPPRSDSLHNSTFVSMIIYHI